METTCLRKAFWACIVILCCLASSANAAGIQLFNHGPALSGAIWYPCQAEPKHVELGDLGVGVDYGLVGVKDCPLTGAKLPLVVFSHGYTGWFGGHHDTAAALADAGFVVAAINHSGDNGNDSSRSDDLSSLWVASGGYGSSARFPAARLERQGGRRFSQDRFVRFLQGRLYRFGAGRCRAGFRAGSRAVARMRRGFCAQLRSGETPSSATGCARPGRGDRRSAKRVLHEGQSGRHQDSAAVLAIGAGTAGSMSIPRARRASPAAFPERLTFMSCRPATLPSWRRARRNSRPPYRAFAPTCPRASTGQRSTANSMRASRGFSANTLLVTARLVDAAYSSPPLPFRRRGGEALVVRFRSSPAIAARSDANFGIQDHSQLYDSSAPLNPKFAFETRGTVCANFGFGALEHVPGRIDPRRGHCRA